MNTLEQEAKKLKEEIFKHFDELRATYITVETENTDEKGLEVTFLRIWYAQDEFYRMLKSGLKEKLNKNELQVLEWLILETMDKITKELSDKIACHNADVIEEIKKKIETE